MPVNPLERRCPTCQSMPDEPCYMNNGTGPMRKTAHDARRRLAGEMIERRGPTQKQMAAMELGSRHFVVSGAVGGIGRIAHAPPVPGWADEDRADALTAFDALTRINERRKARGLHQFLKRTAPRESFER